MTSNAEDAAVPMTWNPAAPPRQDGRAFVVTGGNAGLGYFAAEQLAATGARVVITSRSEEKAEAAMASIRLRVPNADLGFVELDLASLDSARTAGERLAGMERLDGLVLNAGRTTGSPRRKTSADGNELTFGTNYIGHFALAAAAWPALARTAGSRVVGLGSLSTRIVPLDADDLQSERRFGFFRAYAFSKHAMHGLIFELDRRLRATGEHAVGWRHYGARPDDPLHSAVLAHPGLALDGLSAVRPGITDSKYPQLERALAFAAQGKNRGAAATVRALLDPALPSGAFVGPRGWLKGRPVPTRPVRSSASPEFGRRLWELSEEWTGTTFEV